MKIIVNNIHSKLETSDTKLKKVLEKKYTRKITGYRYSRQHKQGGWDGSKKFFSSKTGKFGSGLLSYIIEDLNYIGRDYEIEDLRSEVETNNTKIEGIEYRDYQTALITEALSQKGCIINAPTGAGKTIVLAGILKALENCTGVIFFTKKQLLVQTYKFLKEHGFDVGIVFGDGYDLKPITLCTVQSLYKIVDTHLTESDFIIFDEVHEFSKGKFTTKVIKSFPNASYRIGMTATVPKDPIAKLNLITGLGPVIDETSITELIDQGFLTAPVIQVVKAPKVELQPDFDYRSVYEECITENEKRNELIQEIAEKVSEKPSKTLILVKDLNHAQKLHDMLPGSYKLEGKDSLEQREKIVNEFKLKESSIIIGTTIFQTGIDIPEITHLINARGLKSEIATIQALGRALRTHKSKQQVYIYDFMDDAPYLTQHSKHRIRAYKSLGFEVT